MNSGDAVYLVVILVLIIFSAFFSSAETALTTVSKVRVRILVEQNNKSAVILNKITGNSGKLLSAILIGNNIVNISASAVATLFAQHIFGNYAVSIATGILTIVVLIFGEIIPKTVATIYSEKISLIYARPIYWFMIILTPVIFIIEHISFFILKFFRIDPNKKGALITENELRTIVDVGHEEGIIETDERKMINNVFDFGDIHAKDIMIPRIDVTMSDVSASYDELISLFERDKYTRFPVFENTTDNVIGIINVKDILLNRPDKDNFSIRDYMRKPFYTYEHKNVDELFIELQAASANMAVVLDEYGITEGIITMEDILEEIVGEIRDEYDHDEDELITKISDNEFIVEGQMKIDDINDVIDINLYSEEYDSIGGIIMEQLGHLPAMDEFIILDNCKLIVRSVDKNRIDKVRILLVKNQENE